MATSVTKSELLELVDLLDEPHLVEALDFVRELVAESDRHPRNNNDRLRLGDVIKQGRPTSANDPLWNIVGLVGDDYEGPTDVAANKHSYLTEVYADRHDE